MRGVRPDGLARHQQAPRRGSRDARRGEAAIADRLPAERRRAQPRAATVVHPGRDCRGLPYFGVAQTLNGITAESEAQGYGLLLKEIPDGSVPTLAPVVEFLMARRVEGIVFAAPDLGESLTSLVPVSRSGYRPWSS